MVVFTTVDNYRISGVLFSIFQVFHSSCFQLNFIESTESNILLKMVFEPTISYARDRNAAREQRKQRKSLN